MLSLFFLDHVGWWTTLGNFIKYALICGVTIAGALLFVRSRRFYFAIGWLIVVVFPLTTISLVERLFGSHAIFKNPNHESIFIYVWLFIALTELFIVWVPICAALFHSYPKQPKHEETNA
jgi:FtsH-binding integral membrane protein